MKSAFTLIELLVVIAIIAILAAILFPVFAQAKAAAKKSACLSNIKQIATSAHIYMADSDDLYPNSYAQAAGGVWTPGFAGVPFGTWATFGNAADMAAAKANWIDGMMPYTKNVDIFMSPAATRLVTPFPGISVTNTPGATVQASAYSMNGLLSAYSSTAVGSPSQLVAFWTGTGKTAYVGSALLQPFLICPTTAATCTYAPANASCTSRSTLNIHSPNGWDLHGGGANYAFSDGSAKFRRIGSNSTGATDPKTDPRTNYNAGGAGVGWTYVWMESEMCHPYLFRPDYDFNFSDPAVRL